MFQRCVKVCLNYNSKLQSKIYSRCQSTLSKAEGKKKRNEIFEELKKQRRAAIGRIEKIEVKYESPTDEVILTMNKNLSTPYDCAKHISEGVTRISALALVDGNPWDMHRPLPDACTLKFLNLKSPETHVVNKAFWRTCSLILGNVLDNSFKDDVTVHLHSFPVPLVHSGSFVYDVYLNLPEWKPSMAELQAMAAVFVKLTNQDLPIERVETTESVALNMFEDNPFKYQQIPHIASVNDGKIVLYRIGDHVDISKGPMVGNTNLIGRCSITAVHKHENSNVDNLYRVQGIAIPRGILLNQFAYGILEERARKLNSTAVVPQKETDDFEENMLSAKN